MVPAMRAMFPHVEALIRLLLVNPASSATAERSFSSLRRLKTYLRSTCGQRRLNNHRHIIICHVHKHIMDGVNVPAANERICRGQRHPFTNIRTY